MTEDVFSLTGFVVAMLLPWIFGCAVLLPLVADRGQGWSWIWLGHAYVTGMLLTAAVLYCWNALPGPLVFWPVVCFIVLLTAALFWLNRRLLRMMSAAWRGSNQRWAWHWEYAFALTLLILLGWRFATLVQELALRPLFAWDAWMNWIPRAVVWFNTGELNAFVHPQDWLREGPGADVYTPGNWQAHRYPPGVSLIQLWSMLGAGVARHPLLCLPWAALPLALTAAFYGHLRRAGVPLWLGVAGCYFMLSLPYLNAHVALPGYADPWLAAVFSLALFAIREYWVTRECRWVLSAVFLALACTQLKVPGLVLAGIAAVVLLIARVRPSPLLLGLTALTAGAAVVGVLVFGVSLPFPGGDTIIINSGKIDIPYLGNHELQYHELMPVLWKTMFRMSSWNLYWFILLAVLMAGIVRGHARLLYSAEFCGFLLCLLFILAVFSLTDYYYQAASMVTLNRTLLYCVFPGMFTVLVLLTEITRKCKPVQHAIRS